MPIQDGDYYRERRGAGHRADGSSGGGGWCLLLVLLLLIGGIGGGYYWYASQEAESGPGPAPTPTAQAVAGATPTLAPAEAVATASATPTATPFPCADPTPTPTPTATPAPTATPTPDWPPAPLSDAWREWADGWNEQQVNAALAQSLAVFDEGLDEIAGMPLGEACALAAAFETRLEIAEHLVEARRLGREAVPGEQAGVSWTLWLRHHRALFVDAVLSHAPVAECRRAQAAPTPAATATSEPPPTPSASQETPLPPCPTPTPIPPPTATPAPRPTATPTPTATPMPGPDRRHYQHKVDMLELINQERAQAGVPAVTLGDNIAAQLHAESSLANCISSHWGIDGLKPYMRYSLAGSYQDNGENGLGLDYCITPSDGYRALGSIESEIQDAIESWMGSPGHRRNILDPWHKKVNIGLAWDAYNFMAYQHFEGDYVRYDSLPQIQSGRLSFSGRAINELSFSRREDLGLQLYYDPPPHRLTRGQASRTYCYDQGAQIAAFRYPLNLLSYWPTDSLSDSYTPCPDPYDVPPDAPGARSPDEAHRLHSEAQLSVRPPVTRTIPWITASEWTANGTAFSVDADISGLLSEHGPGVYTILMWGEIGGEDVPVSQYSIFYDTPPPTTYDPSRWQ